MRSPARQGLQPRSHMAQCNDGAPQGKGSKAARSPTVDNPLHPGSGPCSATSIFAESARRSSSHSQEGGTCLGPKPSQHRNWDKLASPNDFSWHMITANVVAKSRESAAHPSPDVLEQWNCSSHSYARHMSVSSSLGTCD